MCTTPVVTGRPSLLPTRLPHSPPLRHSPFAHPPISGSFQAQNTVIWGSFGGRFRVVVISGSILHFSSETAIAICAQDKRGRSHALPILTFGSTAGRSG